MTESLQFCFARLALLASYGTSLGHRKCFDISTWRLGRARQTATTLQSLSWPQAGSLSHLGTLNKDQGSSQPPQHSEGGQGQL